ncbi:maltose permease [Scheffersomyces stipitis CBS 6054]|uniref:Maltose permease n=1 Tax=Scheffersomyces stipitis (strain ATCC 58785 / CBS 6054 / NBRC 10063 / NRRL Y-11545) TaxID=322104 RepID=A3LUP4_PICST|nr:maltose permease [Scheffersomyces stipitis CBS 6054]ABN66994.1 maltose permease [Scheffersomyces stipitis CBS 6054]
MVSEYVEDIKNPEKTIVVESITKKTTDVSSLNSVDDYVARFLDMSNEARDNDNKEKSMPLRECLKTFPKAVMWSIILSTALVMEGYDTNLLNSLFGFYAFNKKFGHFDEGLGDYIIEARWQTALNIGYSCGSVIGLAIAGFFADIYGYRRTLMTALATSVALIFLQFFAPNKEVLLLAYILLGINWGSYQTLTVTYASEVAPTTLRLYLTSYVNVCWVFGQLISSGVLKGVTSMAGNSNSYRIPFAVQWVWPVPLFIGVYLAPESPWFLVKRGRNDEAKISLKRLLSENSKMPDKEVLAQAMLTKIQMTIQEEGTADAGTFKDCFRSTNFRRTRIASLTWLFQSITGAALMGYSTLFYQQAGLPVSMSFNFSIIQYCFGIIGTVGSWFLSQKVGRRPIYFFGLCTMCLILFLVGGLGVSDTNGAKWGVGTLLLIFTFVYDLTVGPLCYCIVAEIPSSKLRTKTVMLSRNMYNVANIIVGVITPYMLNPTAWNWKAKTGFFWAGFSLVGSIWVYFELPETRNRTYAELEVLFQDGVSARKFKSTEVEVFDAGKLMERYGETGIKHFVDHVDNAEEEDIIEKVQVST